MKILVHSSMKQRTRVQLDLVKMLSSYNKNLDFYFLIDSESMIKDVMPYKVILLEKLRNNWFFNFFFTEIRQTFLLRLIRRTFYSVSVLIEAIFLYHELKKYYHWLLVRFKKERFDAIILNGDRHGNTEAVILKIAKKLNIKSICPYYCLSDDVSLISNSYLLQLKFYSPLIVKLLFFLYKDHVFTYQSKKYFYYTPNIFLALKWFGVLSKYPWYIGNGLVDVVCIDSLMTFNRYKENRVPEEKLKIIGDINHQILYESSKNNIKQHYIDKYDLNPKNKIIMCALPQLLEQKTLSKKEHWEEINFLVDTCCKSKESVLLSLHPKMQFEEYRFLEKKYKCIILKESLAESLPIADLFLSINSSTMIWPFYLGINSIILDYYNLYGAWFNSLDNITFSKNKNKLLDEIKKNLNIKKDFKSDWMKLSKDKVFDGKVIQRYSDLLENLKT
ncbi:MAG: hypothetical protein VW378_01995 [bacterium]